MSVTVLENNEEKLVIELDKKSYNMDSINSFLNYLRVEELVQKASFDSQIIDIKEEIENDWLKKYSNKVNQNENTLFY